MSELPTWHPVLGRGKYHEVEVLASQKMHDAECMIAVVENFGYGWYANALPPQGGGTSSTLPGMIRGGNFGVDVEAAKGWCERICGLHPEKLGDRASEEGR